MTQLATLAPSRTPAPVVAPGESSEPSATAHLPFPAAECEALHADDRRATAAIVGIIFAIFAIGLGLYTAICFSVL